MNMTGNRRTVRGLNSFRVGVISRFSPRSIAIPLATDPLLGSYLKLTSSRISVNSPFRSVAVECQAMIANNRESLTSNDIDMILSDAGARREIVNRSLCDWFDESDASWLDVTATNLAGLGSPLLVAIAQKLIMDTGQYALSFTPSTAHLRQPLTDVFLRLVSRLPEPVDNGRRNPCSEKSPRQFVSESNADLMFLSLPSPSHDGLRSALGSRAWREEWIVGGGGFWSEFEERCAGQIHGRIPSKATYLKSLGQLLRSARGIRNWALELPGEASLTSGEVIETIGAIRPVRKIFSKDLSEIGRGRSTIITA